MSAGANSVVVVGVDGTPLSMQALQHACNFVDAKEIIVCFVRQLAPMLGDEPAEAVALYEKSEEDSEHEATAQVKQVLGATSIKWQMLVREGDAGKALIDTAHEHGATLVVVGATLHGPVSSVVHASVANYLVHHCDVSVLIVRPPTEKS